MSGMGAGVGRVEGEVGWSADSRWVCRRERFCGVKDL